MTNTIDSKEKSSNDWTHRKPSFARICA
jgi:hypothetical protein